MRKGTVLVLVLASVVLGGNTCAREPLSRAGDHRSAGARSDSPPAEQRVPIYSGGLKGQWQDWGWAPRTLAKEQPAKLDLSGFGGWILKAKEPPSGASAVVFRFKAPPDVGEFLEVGLGDTDEKAFPKVAVAPSHRRSLGDGWEEVVVSMRELNPHALPFDRVVLRARRSIPAKQWVLLDDVALIMGTADGAPTSASASDGVVLQGPVRDALFTVTCDEDGARIDERIYGVAFAPRTTKQDAHQWNLGATARRWGGNPTERFNWKIGNAWNTANDWFFMNVNYTGDDAWTWRTFLDESRAKNMKTALTLPIMGWVAKDHTSYSFPVKDFGQQQRSDPHNGDAGNGKSIEGKALAPGPATRTSLEVGPAFVASWIQEIKVGDAERGGKSVHTYILGNEPMLWNTTHRDVHPKPVTYDELLERTIAYGTAIRKADPDARIAGPALWGWPAYFYSAADAAAGFRLRPDRRRHGDVPLLEWYLRELHKHEKNTGVKILDAVDVHFYPQGEVHNDRTDPETAAKRVRSTRSLWDPRYPDESWINEPIRLIPRMREIIARNYPGLDLIIGEYNFGGEKHMSGALALAEALGRFGQLGVDEAYYWWYPPSGSPAFWAFRAFRNYDESGARFLDRSVPGQAPDGTSLFASLNDDGSKVVAIALNFSPDEGLDAKLRLRGCRAPANVRVFSLSEQKHGLVHGTSAFKGDVVRALLPPYSVNVFEVTLKAQEKQAAAEPQKYPPDPSR